jgi:hypothetical protein
MKKQTKPKQQKSIKLQTSISLREDLLNFARAQAEEEGRSLSNWLEQRILQIPGAGEITPKAVVAKKVVAKKAAAKKAK